LAETAIVGYRLSFVDQGKQTSVFRFCLLQTNGSFPFPFFVYGYGSDGKWKTKAKAIFLNLFTFCSSCKRKFVVCLFVDEETNGRYPFANGLNRLNGLKGLNGLANV
jgi:hypothetical protein